MTDNNTVLTKFADLWEHDPIAKQRPVRVKNMSCQTICQFLNKCPDILGFYLQLKRFIWLNFFCLIRFLVPSEFVVVILLCFQIITISLVTTVRGSNI